MLCKGCKTEIDRLFKIGDYKKDSFQYPCESNFHRGMIMCTAKAAANYIFEHIPPERREGEDVKTLKAMELLEEFLSKKEK